MLAIEYLNRFECYFLDHGRPGEEELVQRVNHPYFKTMYDTFHANIEEKNAAEAIKALYPHFAHVHISESDRGTPRHRHGPLGRKLQGPARSQVRRLAWSSRRFGRALAGPGTAATKV